MEPEKVTIRRALQVGSSTVVTIAPAIVRKWNIDENTLLEEVDTPEGILLKPRRLA